MKLRLYGDSIRLRLSPADVAVLQQTGRVGEVSHFGPESRLGYWLDTNTNADDIGVRFEGENLIVDLPKAEADHWSNSDEVSINHRQRLPTGGWLKILIEKDFECLHSEDSDSIEELFPNPQNTQC